ncbi:acyl-CoA reductase [Thermodesulfobacteriota bacterium]
MKNSVQIDFFNSNSYADKKVDIKSVIENVRDFQKQLLSWPVDKIIHLIDRFSEQLLDRANPIHQEYPGSGIPFLAAWCRRRQLESLLKNAFHNFAFLDAFTESFARPDVEFRAFPKGIAVHWMAGNVPTLGFLSMIMGLLTKNANIIKVSSISDRLLSDLLSQFSLIEAESEFSGKGLVNSLAVIRYNREDTAVSQLLSSVADVRIFWGSDESVQSLQSFPAKLDSRDIIFPNRTSFIVLGADYIEDRMAEHIAKRMAQDISLFEQKACASPHTVFLLTDDANKINAFALTLKEALAKALKTFPKITPSEKEVSAILNLRARYDMMHEAYYSEGTEFTILVDDLFQLGPAIGNRTIYLRPVGNIDQLVDLVTPNVQTVGIAAEKTVCDHITNVLGACGVHRFTNIGTMTHFDLPWDGYLLPQNLVRWTSRPAKSNSAT